MKASNIREKSKAELDVLLSELCREQFNFKMQKATGQLAKTDRVKSTRRDIARINTVLKQKGFSS